MSEVHKRLMEMVVSGDRAGIVAATRQALEAGADAQSLIDDGLTEGMKTVGRRFKTGELFLPEVLRSAQAMDDALDLLRPILSASGTAGAKKILIGTVEGDIHSIGKDLVAMMLQGAGFRVVNLGVDVKPRAFVDAVTEHDPSVLAMSALLTTTMPMLGKTITALEEAGLRTQVKVIVGGAPVTPGLSSDIGADGYARNAGEAVDVVSSLLDGA